MRPLPDAKEPIRTGRQRSMDIECLSHRHSSPEPMASRRDLLPGTLEMLILRTLTLQPMHGYGISQHIRTVSNDVLQVEEGSLYPALQRMRQKAWIKGEW